MRLVKYKNATGLVATSPEEAAETTIDGEAVFWTDEADFMAWVDSNEEFDPRHNLPTLALAVAR